MHDFRYVTKKQAQPIKDELYQILYMVQDLVRDNFTFSFTPIGSSSRNMITYDENLTSVLTSILTSRSMTIMRILNLKKYGQ